LPILANNKRDVGGGKGPKVWWFSVNPPSSIFFCADPISPLSDTWRVCEAILEDCFEDVWNWLSEKAQYSGNVLAQVPYCIAKNVSSSTVP
jgi:hypothetical protein